MTQTPSGTNNPNLATGLNEGTDRLKREADAARESARAAPDNIKRQAAEVANAARGSVQAAAEEQKHAFSSLMTDIGEAVNAAAGELGNRNQGAAAEYARAVGSGIMSAAQTLNSKSPSEMVSDVTRFARSNPAAYLGGAVLLGVALARFAKASSPSHVPEHGHRAFPDQPSSQQHVRAPYPIEEAPL